MASLYFTAHHNWAWVVEEAVNIIRSDLKLENISLCDKFRDLPSVQASEVKLRPTYSLFRLDFSCSRATGLSLVRTRSDIFGFLDPKDSLCRICQLLSVTKFMPETLLIPWNWFVSSIDTDLHSQIVENLRHGPKLLKQRWVRPLLRTLHPRCDTIHIDIIVEVDVCTSVANVIMGLNLLYK